MSDRMESTGNCSYQTHAGDAGVVGDVGDVEDFPFVLTAGLGTCEPQQEGDKGETQTEGGAGLLTVTNPPDLLGPHDVTHTRVK